MKSELGSSPHTRGTSDGTDAYILTSRFIPAHAGNMTKTGNERFCLAVHPRTRGEHMIGVSACRVVRGSSPHTRGTYTAAGSAVINQRFIPAHAGNIEVPFSKYSIWSVHPRTRGEHANFSQGTSSNYGSSPHTRGTLFTLSTNSRVFRFIPAHAGNMRCIRK